MKDFERLCATFSKPFIMKMSFDDIATSKESEKLRKKQAPIQIEQNQNKNRISHFPLSKVKKAGLISSIQVILFSK